MNKVRMSDIAEKLGISVVSVSKGLSGKDGVGAELRRKILETAEKLGYQVPETALPVNIRNFGAVVPDRFFHENVLYYEMYRCLLDECQHKGISLMLETVSYEKESALTMPALLQTQRPDGIILLGEFSDGYCRKLLSQGVPAVFLDFYKTEIPCEHVISDSLTGSYAVTRHLLDTGRRKIAYVGTIGATSSITDRYLGYAKALLTAGIFPRQDWLLGDRGADGELVPVQLPAEIPEAFVCNCDTVAYTLIDRLNSLGYRVPEDVAVVGYDDYKFSAMCRPPLTTYRVDIDEMARDAAALLARKILKKRNLSRSVLVPGELVVRESSAVPQKGV